MATPRIAEVASLGLLKGQPTANSPFLYVAPPGASISGDVAPLGILVEPSAAWSGAGARATQLIAAARRAIANMTTLNTPAQLHGLLDALNAEQFERIREVSGRCSGSSGFGIVCVAQAGADLYIAQTPPGQFSMRQGAQVFAFPPGADAAVPPIVLGVDDGAPLGQSDRITPRLLRTRVAADDLVMLASSTIVRWISCSAHESLAGSPDEVLTEIGRAVDRARLRDGAVGIMRFD